MPGETATLASPVLTGSAPPPAGTDARLVYVLSPIPGPTGKYHTCAVPIASGQQVRAYIPHHQVCAVSIDGGVIAPEAYDTRIVAPGEELLIKATLGYTGVAALIVYLAASIAIGLLTAYLSSVIFPSSRPKMQEPDEPTYGFEGIRTTVGPGNKVPVIYGRHRVGGQLIAASVEIASTAILSTDGNAIAPEFTEQLPVLNLLIALGEGVIQDVETGSVELNGQPIANFPFVTLDYRVGYAEQPPIPFFGATTNTFADGREFTTGPIIYTTTAAVDAYIVHILFPEGLISLGNTRGERESNTVVWRVRHRVSPSGAWSNWNTVTTTAMRTTSVRVAVRREALPLVVYDVQLEFVSARDTDISGHFRIYLESVSELQNGTQTYPNTALLGIRAVATENLNGAIPNVTVVVQGLRVRSGSFASPPTFTPNPSWCLMDFLTNARYGLGIPDSEINLPAFINFGTYCNEIVQGEFRHVLDLVLIEDAEASILQILAACRGMLYKFQGLWTPVAMRDEPPIQLLSWTNCTNVKLAYSRDHDRINVMEGRFADVTDNWEQNVITWPPEPQWPVHVRKSTMDLRGVVRRSAVMRHLQYELNRRQIPKLTLQMDCTLDALALTANDVFRFSHPLPGWGISGRIQPGSTTTNIQLDEDAIFETGGQYHLYVRHENDVVETRPVIHPGPGSTNFITLATPLSQTPSLSHTTLYAFGKSIPLDTAIREFRVTKMERLGNNTVRLQALQHNASIYDDAVATPLPSTDLLFNPLGPPPELTDLIATEFQRVGIDGHFRSAVNLAWDVAPLTQGFAPYAGAIIYRRTVTSGAVYGRATFAEVEFAEDISLLELNSGFERIATVGPGVLEYNDDTVVPGLTYRYKVIPISARGVPNSLDGGHATIHVSGPTTPQFFPGTPRNLRLHTQVNLGYVEEGYVLPGYVEGFIEDVPFEGRDLHITWDSVGNASLFTSTFFIDRYRIELWAGNYLYLLRRDHVPAPRNPVHSASYVYTYQQNLEDQIKAGQTSARRDLLIAVWAIANTSLETVTPAYLLANNLIPDMSAVPLLADALIEAIALDWTAYEEPHDLLRYNVFLGTAPDALLLLTSMPPGTQRMTIANLSPVQIYYMAVEPEDTFGPGIRTVTVTQQPRTPVQAAESFSAPGVTFSNPGSTIASQTILVSGGFVQLMFRCTVVIADGDPPATFQLRDHTNTTIQQQVLQFDGQPGSSTTALVMLMRQVLLPGVSGPQIFTVFAESGDAGTTFTAEELVFEAIHYQV